MAEEGVEEQDCHVGDHGRHGQVGTPGQLKLGSKRHHDALLKGIDTLEDIGCFGLTELGKKNLLALLSGEANGIMTSLEDSIKPFYFNNTYLAIECLDHFIYLPIRVDAH